MSDEHTLFGSPDPFLAFEADIDVDAEGSRSHHSFLSVDNSNSTVPAEARSVVPRAKRSRREESDEDARTWADVSQDEIARCHADPPATSPPVAVVVSAHPLNNVMTTLNEKTDKSEEGESGVGASATRLYFPRSAISAARHAWSLLTDAYTEAVKATTLSSSTKTRMDAERNVSAAKDTSRQTTAHATTVAETENESDTHADAASTCSTTSTSTPPAPTTRQDPRRQAEQELSCASQHTFSFLLTDALHAVMWYVLRHAGPGLSVPALVTARSILDLAPPPFSTMKGDIQEESADGTAEVAGESRMRLEATELLIRMALRKPSSFTQEHLIAQYGDQLHVQQALELLSHTAWRGEEEARADAAGAAASTQPHTLLRHNNGRRVSALLTALYPVALRYRNQIPAHADAAPGLSPSAPMPLSQVEETAAGRELLGLLYAVRVRELRTLAFALYYHYHPTTAPPPPMDATDAAQSVLHRANARSGENVDARADEDEDGDDPGDERDARVSGEGHGKRKRTRAGPVTAPAAPRSSTVAASTLIPVRKREILQYLIEQRYREHASTAVTTVGDESTNSTVVSVVARHESSQDTASVVAALWQLHIGSLYTIPTTVKRHVHALAVLFHALSGNLGAGGVLATMAMNSAATAAAASSLAVALPSSLLLTRPQLLLIATHARHRLACAMLLRRLRSGTDASTRETAAPQSPTSSWLPPWWWSAESAREDSLTPHRRTVPQPTLVENRAAVESVAGAGSACQEPPSSLRPSRLFPPHCVRARLGSQRAELILFPSVKALDDYQEALLAHQELFLLTDASASSPVKQQLRDVALVQRWYTRAMASIDRVKHEAHLASTEHRTPPSDRHAPSATGRATCTLREVLQQYGLFAQHLLQFLPLYRWFAYLELLVAVLQSRRLYKEANVCLRVLTEEPLFTLHPPPSSASSLPTGVSAPGADTGQARTSSSSVRGLPPRRTKISAAARAATTAALTAASFRFYYRPEKHGEWRQRLALNLTHLQQHEEAMEVLEVAHARWYTIWAAAGTHASESRERHTTAIPPPSPCAVRKAEKTKHAPQRNEALSPSAGGEKTSASAASLRALVVFADRLADRLCISHSVPYLNCNARDEKENDVAQHATVASRRTDAQLRNTNSRFTRCDRSSDALASADDATLLAQLPVDVQRRCRLLRSTFPLSHDIAAYHAVMEALLPRCCRRADRLVQEKLLRRLHIRLRKWTPLPGSLEAFTTAVKEVPFVWFEGCRDALDPQLWRAPSSRLPVSAARTTRRGKCDHAHVSDHSRDDLQGTSPKVSTAAACGDRDDEEEDEGERGGRANVETLYRAHNGSSAAPAGVEEYVRRRCLEMWNERPTTTPHGEDTHRPFSRKRTRPSTTSTTAACETDSAVWGQWRGAHCEGAWVALAARALLWDCYYAPFSPRMTSGTECSHSTTPASGTAAAASRAIDVDPYYAWLTPFQEAPLDVLSSVQFCFSRRRAIDDRLNYLARCSKETLLRYVAARVHNDGSDSGPQRRRPVRVGAVGAERAPHNRDQHTKAGKTDDTDKGDGEEETAKAVPSKTSECRRDDEAEDSALFSDSDDRDDDAAAAAQVALSQSVMEASTTSSIVTGFSQPHLSTMTTTPTDAVHKHTHAHTEWATATTGDANRDTSERSPTAERHVTIDAITQVLEQSELADHFRVDLGGFPLLDLLHAVPQQPLIRLLRHLYLEPFTEGYSVKFSGFPDLVFWRSRAHTPPVCAFEAGEDGCEPPRDTGVGCADDASRDTFRLMEVKSPSDSLSAKQMCINDCLQRCGFRVEVANIVEVHEGGADRMKTTSVQTRQPNRTSTHRGGTAKATRAQTTGPTTNRKSQSSPKKTSSKDSLDVIIL